MDTLNRIKLNVGGETCITYYDTLIQSPYFQDLVLHKKAPKAFVVETKDDDVEYFIDRDGDAFRDIMYYLRTSEIQEKDEEQLKILKNEAEFYQFNDMVKKIDQMIVDSKNKNTCYSVKELPSVFDTLKATDSGQIEPFKSRLNIVAGYKHFKMGTNYEYEYKLVIKK